MMKQLLKYENYAFWACIALNLIPFFSHELFLTYDGPSHLYNAMLLKELLTGSSASIFHQFIEINSMPVPNWSGHFLLMINLFFFDAFTAEKIVLIIYAIGLPLSFRYYLKQMNGDVLFSYLIFPFVFSFVFIMGFYNFCLGLVVFFFVLGRSISMLHNPKKSIWREISTFFIFALLYFSHFFLFSMALLIVFSYYTLTWWQEEGRTFKSLIRKFYAFLPVIPLIFLSILFQLSIPTENKLNFIDRQELIENFMNVRSLICWIEDEGLYTQLIFYFLLGITAIILFNFIRRLLNLNKENLSRLKNFKALASGNIFGLFLMLYFISPDSNNWSGYVSVRLEMMVLLFWIVWVASFKMKKVFVFVGVALALFVTWKLDRYYKSQNPLNVGMVVELNGYQGLFKEKSVVQPMNFLSQPKWFNKHVGGYIGTDKKLLYTYNYEAEMNYFPLKWKEKDRDLSKYDLKMNEDCELHIHLVEEGKRDVDYILAYGRLFPHADCGQEFTVHDSLGFKLLKRTDYILLFGKSDLDK